MVVRILAGGPAYLIPDHIFSSEEQVLWIGVDSGTVTLLRRHIQPAYAFGDFDSVSAEEKLQVQRQPNVHIFAAEKDKTDLELALDWCLEQGYANIEVYGATGGRLDHELANIRLLYKSLSHTTFVSLIDTSNIISAYAPGRYQVQQNHDYPYISFMPMFADITELTLRGFRYPLEAVDLQKGSTLTVSNELTEREGECSFVTGTLLMIRSRDVKI